MLGWMLDALDVMLYSFALLSMQKEFGLTGAQAGALTTVTLLAAAVGGTLAGVMADRFGRTRVLMASILTYSIFTAMIATSHSYGELLIWRSLVGLGLGALVSAAGVWPKIANSPANIVAPSAGTTKLAQYLLAKWARRSARCAL